MSETETQELNHREIPGMFEGPILPLLLKMAIPMYLGMLVQLLYNITDTFFVSRIDMNDPSIVGGTGLIFPLIFLAIAMANGLMSGSSSLVARALGARKMEVLFKTAESSLVLGALGALIIFLPLKFLTKPLVYALGAEGDFALNGIRYLEAVSWSVIPMLLVHALGGILQGEGKMNYVMKAMFIGTLGNIILDPVFIFSKGEFGIGYFGMGIEGAAWATVIAQSMGTLYIFIVFIAQKTTVKLDWKVENIKLSVMGEILRVGIPQTLSQILLSFSFMIINRIAIHVDPNALTAFSLTGRVDNAVLMPLFALGAALVTTVGQNSARGNWDRAVKIWATGIKAGFTAVFVLATLMILLAKAIYPQFSEVKEVISYAVRQTYILEYTFLGIAMTLLSGSTFQAMGKPIPGLMLMVFRLFVFSVPVILLLVLVLDMGVLGIYLGIAFANIATAILSFFWTRRTFKDMKAHGTHTI